MRQRFFEPIAGAVGAGGASTAIGACTTVRTAAVHIGLCAVHGAVGTRGPCLVATVGRINAFKSVYYA